MIQIPNLALSVCALALFSSTADDVSTKPASPFPTGFSFVGSWNCSGTFRGGKPHRASFSGSAAVGNKWLVLTEVDVEPATGYEATYLIGYDATGRGLVEFDANTFGAATYRSSQGWQAGILTMESQDSASTAHSWVADRFVYSVSLVGEFTVEWQIKRQHESAWLRSDHLLCKALNPA